MNCGKSFYTFKSETTKDFRWIGYKKKLHVELPILVHLGMCLFTNWYCTKVNKDNLSSLLRNVCKKCYVSHLILSSVLSCLRWQ